MPRMKSHKQEATHGQHAAPTTGASAAQAPAKKSKGWRLAYRVAIVVFICALLALGAIVLSYWLGQRAYDELADEAGLNTDATLEAMTVDWDKLKSINPDIVAWIYVPGTVINYPVCQADDDTYYLTHSFDGGEGVITHFGTIFLEAKNSSDFSDPNNFLYGHHMRNGSMFAAIAAMQDVDNYNEHRTIYLLTPQGNYHLRSFSMVHSSADDAIVQTTFSSEKSFQNYVQDKIDRNIFNDDTIPAASEIKRTFAFATCDELPTDGRYILFAYEEKSTVPGDTCATGIYGSSSTDQSAVNEVRGATEKAAA